MNQPGTIGRPRRGSPSKRQVISDAARAVFIREGYVRASVDSIAAEARVSKRTIYNHFSDKQDLFRTVVHASVTAFTRQRVDLAERYLDNATDLESALIDYGRAWQAPDSAYSEHLALVRVLMAEAAHFPAVIEEWQRMAGEMSSQELATRLRRFADQGLLDIEDADVALSHYVALVLTPVTNRTFYRTLELSDEEVDGIVRSGVRAFLRIYGTER